ncbi:MAG: DUF4173 domain-containing protein [Candidatus Paceibacterota bacterium]|jgi:hypothetical protein|nr:DUF4173 domain-containing protein [Candidatus Paceibacterota bacterium]
MNTLNRMRLYLIGAVSLILGLLFVILFYNQEIGLNYSLFMAAVALAGLWLARSFSRKIGLEQYAIVAAGMFFASMVFVRSSELLTVLNVLGSVFLLLTGVKLFAGGSLRMFSPFDYIKVPTLPFSFIGPFFETFSEIVALKKLPGDTAKTREIVRGSFMAIVALLIFAWLFSSADAGFAKLLSNIFSVEIDQGLINRTFLAAFISAFFVGAFAFMFVRSHTSPASSEENVRHLGGLETTILLVSINALFTAFIILQISYLFGGASHIIAEGLTYSEYAREGFFQLVIVALLSFFIIGFAERQVVQKDGGHLRSFKILCGTLVFLVIVILVSAFTRLSLYENAYGFTVIRLFSHAFMVWLGIMLSLLAFHIWKNGKPSELAFQTFCSAVIFLFMMNAINPDVFIAKQNLERYRSTGLIDAQYLGSLSDDALPHTFHLLNDPKEDVSRSFARGLYWGEHERRNFCKGEACQETSNNTWQSNRLNYSKAEKLLAPVRAQLEENKSWTEPTPDRMR